MDCDLVGQLKNTFHRLDRCSCVFFKTFGHCWGRILTVVEIRVRIVKKNKYINLFLTACMAQQSAESVVGEQGKTIIMPSCVYATSDFGGHRHRVPPYMTRGTRPLQLWRSWGPSVFGPLQLL